MKGEYVYNLTRTVANPCYDAGFRRGLCSVREFRAGLPIVVYRMPDGHQNFFSWSRVRIDIPILRLRINDLALVDKLLGAAHQPRLPDLPAGETYIACGQCHNTLWRNIMRKDNQMPLSSRCVDCGNEIKILRLLHAPGHA
jgi:hypothetical protein